MLYIHNRCLPSDQHTTLICGYVNADGSGHPIKRGPGTVAAIGGCQNSCAADGLYLRYRYCYARHDGDVNGLFPSSLGRIGFYTDAGQCTNRQSGRTNAQSTAQSFDSGTNGFGHHCTNFMVAYSRTGRGAPFADNLNPHLKDGSIQPTSHFWYDWPLFQYGIRATS